MTNLKDQFANKEASPLAQKLNSGLFGYSADLPRIVELDVTRLIPNPDQPRQYFDPESIAELASSIEAQGLLQPILVQALDDGFYKIVAGERRYRAHRLLKRETIAAIVVSNNVEEIAIIENVQREDLKPLELAESLARLMESHGYTHTELAKVIGKPRSTISELLSILKLPESVKAACRSTDTLGDSSYAETLSKTFLVELSKLEPADLDRAWADFKDGKLGTVRALKDLANKTAKPAGNAVTVSAVSHDGVVASVPLSKKPKRVFHTQHQAIVIVQADGDVLTDVQVAQALREAVDRVNA